MVATRIEGGSGLTERIAGRNSKIWPTLDTGATLHTCAEIISQIRVALKPPSSTAGICLSRMCERSDFPSATIDFCQTTMKPEQRLANGIAIHLSRTRDLLFIERHEGGSYGGAMHASR
jgi:hypothetical protein